MSSINEKCINGSPYRILPWEWSDYLLDRVDNCVFAYEFVSNFRSSVSLSRVVPSKDAILQIMAKQRNFGYSQRASFLWDRFELHFKALTGEYYLDEHGIAIMPLAESSIILFNSDALKHVDPLNRINILFADFISSGKRLTDAMDHMLRASLGGDAEGYRSWKEQSAVFFDDNLEYAILQELRNEMEHGNAFISVANYNPRNSTLQISLNIDSGLLKRDVLKRSVRERVRDYGASQISEGRPPWFSVGKMVNSYHMEIGFLYLLFLRAVINAYRECALNDEVKAELFSHNCIYYSANCNDAGEVYFADRIYPLPTGVEERLMLAEIRRVAKELGELLPEAQGQINRIVESCDM